MSLSDRAWKHIRERHPEVSNYRSIVVDVVRKPEVVFKGYRGVKKATRYLDNTHLGPKYLVVVYNERERQKAIITAYFTSDMKRIKGEEIWKA